MSRARRTWMMLTLALVAGGVALAQDGAPGSATEPKTPPTAGGSDLDVPAARYLDSASKLLIGMRDTLGKGLDQLRKAREENDAVQVLCVNEAVTAMKGVLRVAETANVDLQEAIATSQTAEARLSFRRVATSKRRMDELYAQTLRCVGASSTVSTTSVEMEMDESLAAIDPYYGNPEFFVDPQDVLADGSRGGLGQPDPPNVRPPPASATL